MPNQTADKWSAVFAGLAVVVAAGSAIYTWKATEASQQLAAKANDIAHQGLQTAKDSLRLSEASDNRTKTREIKEIAAKVQLVEAPDYATARHPLPSGHVWRAVANASGEEIHDVWVRMTDGRNARMFDVAPCTMYAVPSDSFPAVLHFKDSHGSWQSTFYTGPEAGADVWPVSHVASSPWAEPIQGCAP